MPVLSLYELNNKKLNATKESVDALKINAATVNGFTLGRNVGASDVFLTSAEKNKLTGIQAGAEVNQNAFSNLDIISGTTTSTLTAGSKTDTFKIKSGTGITLNVNKATNEVTINGVNQYVHPAAHSPSIITQDASNRFVSDSQINTWNSKMDRLSYQSAGQFDTTGYAPTAVNRINFNGYFYATRVYNAVYNDLAEYFKRGENEILSYGDIIISKGDGTFGRSTHPYQKSVIGVYSDTFGQCLGGNGTKKDEIEFISVGIAGRVNVKVIGKVEVGDLLTSSDIPGVAMKAEEIIPGTIIGKVLENKNEDGIKRISMLIMNI